MITKFIKPPILMFGQAQRKRSGGLENQVGAGISAVMPAQGQEIASTEIRKTVNGSVVTFEGTYQGKPIRIRIFNEGKGAD